MIIVRITSGLGNQLFQYATARRLADKHNADLKIDMIGFASDRQRRFELDCFNIKSAKASVSDIMRLYPMEGIVLFLLKPLMGSKSAGKLVLWLEQKFRNFQKHYNQQSAQYQHLIKRNLLIQRFYHFDPEIPDSRDNIYMIGYFQSWKYFSDIRPILIRELQPKKPAVGINKELLNHIMNEESVAIHVRRGDYFSDAANRKLFEVYDMQYFEHAIKVITQRTVKPVFFVFSDDAAWVKKNLRSDVPLTYVENINADQPAEDLRLMSHCRHAIISNSSFSWWGAWLNQNPDKMVIAPAKWLNDGAYDTSDLLPPEWITL